MRWPHQQCLRHTTSRTISFTNENLLICLALSSTIHTYIIIKISCQYGMTHRHLVAWSNNVQLVTVHLTTEPDVNSVNKVHKPKDLCNIAFYWSICLLTNTSYFHRTRLYRDVIWHTIPKQNIRLAQHNYILLHLRDMIKQRYCFSTGAPTLTPWTV